MNAETIKQVVIDQKNYGNVQNNQIERDVEQYVYDLAHPGILIISGVRRCGKSTLLHKYRQKVKQGDNFINFDDERLVNFELEDFQKLYEVFLELHGEQEYYFFDEIQNVEGWERFIRRLHDMGKKCVITGSNALMLSRELGTYLTGRYIQVELYPFSFREFIRYTKKEFSYSTTALSVNEHIQYKKLLLDYIQIGGFPEYCNHKQREYLDVLYKNILYRDIIVRHNIKSEESIRKYFHYIASNTGKLLSYNKIKELFGIKNVTTLKNYTYYFEESYLAFSVVLFDDSFKKQHLNPKKIYLIDTGLAYMVGFQRSKDLGRMIENIVFLELQRNQAEIYYYHGKGEYDFISYYPGGELQAIQVIMTLEDKNVMDREINGLLEAMKTMRIEQGIILTMDTMEKTLMYDGKEISIMPVWKWLLKAK